MLFRGMYQGTVSTFLRDVPFSIVYFSLYGIIVSFFIPAVRDWLHSLFAINLMCWSFLSHAFLDRLLLLVASSSVSPAGLCAFFLSCLYWYCSIVIFDQSPPFSVGYCVAECQCQHDYKIILWRSFDHSMLRGLVACLYLEEQNCICPHASVETHCEDFWDQNTYAQPRTKLTEFHSVVCVVKLQRLLLERQFHSRKAAYLCLICVAQRRFLTSKACLKNSRPRSWPPRRRLAVNKVCWRDLSVDKTVSQTMLECFPFCSLAAQTICLCHRNEHYADCATHEADLFFSVSSRCGGKKFAVENGISTILIRTQNWPNLLSVVLQRIKLADKNGKSTELLASHT